MIKLYNVITCFIFISTRGEKLLLGLHAWMTLEVRVDFHFLSLTFVSVLFIWKWMMKNYLHAWWLLKVYYLMCIRLCIYDYHCYTCPFAELSSFLHPSSLSVTFVSSTCHDMKTKLHNENECVVVGEFVFVFGWILSHHSPCLMLK